MSAVDPKRVKQIKIDTGVVKRLGKEKQAYEKEIVKQEERIEKMKSEGKDEYDIKKQHEVLDESKMMIPDCQRRLKVAREKLEKLLEGESDLQETEEYKVGLEVLADTAIFAGSS